MIRLTLNAAVTEPAALEIWNFETFDSLCEAIEASAAPGEKDSSDLLVQVADWKSFYRNKANITRMSSIFLGDVDAKTDEEIDDLVSRLDCSGYLYTTHSHLTPKKNCLHCYRVVIELDREYEPADFPRVWEAVNHRIGGHLDPNTTTPEKGYYLPAYSSDCEHLFESCRIPGRIWCVDELLSEVGTLSPVAQPSRATGAGPSSLAFAARIKSWTRTKDPIRKQAAKAARSLIDGRNEVPLHAGLRNDFLIRLAGFLARTWPSTDPEKLAKNFETVGWDLFNADGKYPLNTLVAMIERLQAAEAEKTASDSAEKILEATCGDRDHPIIREEIEGLKKVFGPAWQRHLIAIHEKNLYLLRPDASYDPHPVHKDDLFVATRDRFAVFGELVEYNYEDERGTHRKTKNIFLEEYATVVYDVLWDMTLERGGWDAKNHAVLFAAAQPKVESVGHDVIQDWLEAAGGDYLCDWIAESLHFDKMLPALILTGPKSIGKTILARGLGLVFGRDPLDGEVAFSNFNATEFCRQPIVFMDEKASSQYRQEGTTLIRKFLTCGSRMLDEKYRARVELRGFPRLIIAANNMDVLNTNEEMSSADREAFAERLLHIDLSGGQEILRKHRKHIQSHWLNEGWLAEHMRYLADNWEVRNPGERFAVASNHTKLHDSMASRAGYSGDVMYWLLSYLASPERATSGHLPIAIVNGKLRVNSTALVQGWGYYLKDHRPPTPSQISRALKSIASPKRQKIKVGGRSLHAYEVDTRLFVSANESYGLVPDIEKILQ